jgi:hypothetical protein
MLRMRFAALFLPDPETSDSVAPLASACRVHTRTSVIRNPQMKTCAQWCQARHTRPNRRRDLQ